MRRSGLTNVDGLMVFLSHSSGLKRSFSGALQYNAALHWEASVSFLNMKQVKYFVNPNCINKDQEMWCGAFCIHWVGVVVLPGEALLV